MTGGNNQNQPEQATGGNPGRATVDKPVGATDGDTTGPEAAGDALGTQASVAAAGVVPPRVTLTIDFGTLSADSITAIATFVQSALSARPALALGDGSKRPVTATGGKAPAGATERKVIDKAPARTPAKRAPRQG